jgi:hypothetical protein
LNPRENLKTRFSEKIDENFDELQKYYDHTLTEMSEVNSLKAETLNCLLFGLYTASITSTSHLLERIMKMALIKFETKGLTYSDCEKYNKAVNQAHVQFDHLKLPKTISLANSKGLLSSVQFQYLNDNAKSLRDAYSHAQTGVINKDLPQYFSGFFFDFSKVKNGLVNNKNVDVTRIIDITKSSPAVAQLHQDNSSKANALDFFEKVYSIICDIEKKLRE